MDPTNLLILAFLILPGGAVITATTGGNRRLSGWIAFISVATSVILIVMVAGQIFMQGTLQGPKLFEVPGLGASLAVALDRLSALFLILIALVALMGTLFSMDYMARYREESLTRFYPFLLLFVTGMVGVVSVGDWFFFFIFWELMTLASYFLVVFERDDPKVLRAGFKYFLMTHVATACMFIAAIVLWGNTGGVSSFGFDASSAALMRLSASAPIVFHVLLALWFIGFATKAGVFPFGDWQPDAYPAAPSGATAIFAGVMSKMGVYGLLRIFFWILPAQSVHTDIFLIWGTIIATFGVLSAFVGSVTAVRQDDCKRLLAFSSIGQVGYILLALGIGLIFLPTYPTLAALALLGGLFHVVNDALYKSLLFLNTGAILYRTGTRDLNRIGGLYRWMPLTGMAALIGALSLAGIPPLNGFVSKWLIYQAAIFGGTQFKILIGYAVAAVFISVVTLAYALKLIGIAFLGKAPAEMQDVPAPNEVPDMMQIAQGVLATFCVLVGILPGVVLSALYGTLEGSVLSLPAWATFISAPGLGLQIALLGVANAIWNPILMLLALLVCIIIAAGVLRLGGASVRQVQGWYCGEELPEEALRFRARGLYAPFTQAFRNVYPEIRLPRVGYPFALKRLFDFDEWLYNPIVRAGGRLIERFSRTHVGIPQMYMLWQVVGVALVVVILFWMVR